MSEFNKTKIDWKSLVPNQRRSSKKSSSPKEIKSYMQELAGHDILISVICNDFQGSLCSDFLDYLQSGNLFWFKYLKQSSHLNLSYTDGKIKMLFKKNSDWKEVLVDLKKENKYQENMQ